MDNPQAFPQQIWNEEKKEPDIHPGMTLRDYFASAVLNGIISRGEESVKDEQTSKWSYEIADAMLRERTKYGTPTNSESD